MHLLLLGGTAWVGRHIAAAALSRGHQVTCLARGESGAVVPGAHLIRADRDSSTAFDDLHGIWDAVIDVSRQPGQVRRAVAALAGAGQYLFVSSVNVYADTAAYGHREDVALVPPLAGDVLPSMEQYGQAKVACEQAVLGGFGPSRSLIARASLLGGPGDPFDRTGYWPLRFARPVTDDGSVLVPDAPSLPTQVLDVRDLAAWLVESAEVERAGIFNATGDTVSLGEHLTLAHDVGSGHGHAVAASPDWLRARGVEPWMGPRSLPLWLPPGWEGLNAADGSLAWHHGLSVRPLGETLADILAEELTRPADRPRQAGLTAEDERALMAELAETADRPRVGA
ncbi:NAD-dependent epimerase/dehydratase family protein [Naasia aerilata]|uniref:Reductase n=1 Tax=Naasia aerilata TaxID=1162966 RepID=A0ABM8GGW3_9MICO|nr:NAD-dependent epimerase/dehydratase family protein [Naasia aerilata]BDZ47580.1 reductase [Naasia aerilata]